MPVTSKWDTTTIFKEGLKAIVCLTSIFEKSDDSNFSIGYYFHPEVTTGFSQATNQLGKQGQPILSHGILNIIKWNQQGGLQRVFLKFICFINFHFITLLILLKRITFVLRSSNSAIFRATKTLKMLVFLSGLRFERPCSLYYLLMFLNTF